MSADSSTHGGSSWRDPDEPSVASILLYFLLVFARFFEPGSIMRRSNKSKNPRQLAVALIMSVYAATAAVAQVPLCPVAVQQAKPDLQLTKQFVRKSGWTGGDAAYSRRLDQGRNLWLFGDSFIGKIDQGQRIDPKMVHNACAWQDLSGQAAMRFFWKTVEGKPLAILNPEHKDAYYWPSDCALVDGRLYIFCKRIKDDPSARDPAFAFKWVSDDLIQVVNPSDPPTQWRIHSCPLPGSEVELHLGSGCCVEGDFLYIFATRLVGEGLSKHHNLMMSRIELKALSNLDLSRFQYWCHNPDADEETSANGIWRPEPINPLVLFADGAPEMSVGQVKGFPGFFAVYTQSGLGEKIMLRHSTSLESPWSEPLLLYRCPEASLKGVNCYGAKNHAELASDRSLTITYCCNPGPISAHVRRPGLYFPRAVEVLLKPAHITAPKR